MTSRAPKERESDVQRMIVILLRTLGFAVYDLSQGYRKEAGGTRQTPGLPDLYAFHKGKEVTIWIEVKPAKEMARLDRLLARPAREIPKSAARAYRRAVAQQQFGALCGAVGQPYARGGVEEVVEALRPLGFTVGRA